MRDKWNHLARYCRRRGRRLGNGIARFRWPIAAALGVAAFLWLASESRPLYNTPMCIVYDDPALKAGRK